MNYKIFFLEDDDIFQTTMHKYLTDNLPKAMKRHTFDIQRFDSFDRPFLEEIEQEKPPVLLLDYRLANGTKEILGSTVLKEVQKISPNTEVIMLTVEDNLDTAIKMMKSGAYDYIVKSETAMVKTARTVSHIISLKDVTSEKKKNKRFITLLASSLAFILGVGIFLWASGILRTFTGAMKP